MPQVDWDRHWSCAVEGDEERCMTVEAGTAPEAARDFAEQDFERNPSRWLEGHVLTVVCRRYGRPDQKVTVTFLKPTFSAF